MSIVFDVLFLVFETFTGSCATMNREALFSRLDLKGRMRLRPRRDHHRRLPRRPEMAVDAVNHLGQVGAELPELLDSCSDGLEESKAVEKEKDEEDKALKGVYEL